MMDAPPIGKGPPMPKIAASSHPATTSKSPAVPPKETQKAKAPVVKVPSISLVMDKLQLPAIELSVPPKAQQPPNVECKGNAGTRAPSEARARQSTTGSAEKVPDAASTVLGRGTASIQPPIAVGTAGVPVIQTTERESRSGSRSR